MDREGEVDRDTKQVTREMTEKTDITSVITVVKKDILHETVDISNVTGKVIEGKGVSDGMTGTDMIDKMTITRKLKTPMKVGSKAVEQGV